MNCKLLNEAIANSNIKKKAFKEALGVSYLTLQRKLSGESELTGTEMYIISSVLKLTAEDKLRIFFEKDGN